LYKLENKINDIKEDKAFLSKEIENAKTYNMFLKSKIAELENTPKVDMSQNNSLVKPIFTTVDNSGLVDKIEMYLKRNENILHHKLANEDKIYRERISTLKGLDSFNNIILEVLGSKLREYQMNMLQKKVKNEEVFFSNSDNFSKRVIRYNIES
jgi:hypothetical protein